MPDLASALKEIFSKTEDVEFAYLFGSHARDEVFALSDIDIAVYMRSESISFDNELRLHSFLSRQLKCNNIDLVILNKAKNLMLLEDVVRYGKVICDRNPQLRESFELRVLHNAIDFKYQRGVFAGR